MLVCFVLTNRKIMNFKHICRATPSKRRLLIQAQQADTILTPKSESINQFW